MTSVSFFLHIETSDSCRLTTFIKLSRIKYRADDLQGVRDQI